MILSTQSLIMQRAYGYEDGVRALKRIGFDAYDFTMFDMAEQPDDPMTRADFSETCRSLRKAADEAGILCNQTHAPFPSRKADDAAWNGVIFDYLARSVEITSLLGGNVCVIHPCNDYTAKQNAELLYRPLEKHARKFGVKIALENMWNFSRQANKAVPCACSTAEDFLKHLDLLDPEYFVACLDIGHAEMLGDCVSAAELIRALGPRLQALHVHDNDRAHDWHTFPYAGNIDWEPVYAALREIRYAGELTFEAGLGIMKFPPELQYDATVLLHAIGRYMISRIENE